MLCLQRKPLRRSVSKISCLKRSKGHTSFNRTRRKECEKKGPNGTACKRHHHELLHEAESSDVAHVAFIQGSSKAILPVITSAMQGKQGQLVEANVFYDSGAQVSMIRSAYADQLGLDNKPIKKMITKVGVVEEELDTKLYKVPLYAHSGRMIQTIQAVGIPQISEEPSRVDMSHISRVLDIPADKLYRKAGPIDLLIGINYPRFHVGETRVRDDLVARRSLLG